MENTTFRCRAECASDVGRALFAFACAWEKLISVKMHDFWMGEPIVDITVAGLSREDIILRWQQVPDLHVMIQTLQPIDKYDGVRKRVPLLN